MAVLYYLSQNRICGFFNCNHTYYWVCSCSLHLSSEITKGATQVTDDVRIIWGGVVLRMEGRRLYRNQFCLNRSFFVFEVGNDFASWKSLIIITLFLGQFQYAVFGFGMVLSFGVLSGSILLPIVCLYPKIRLHLVNFKLLDTVEPDLILQHEDRIVKCLALYFAIQRTSQDTDCCSAKNPVSRCVFCTLHSNEGVLKTA